MKEEHDDLSGSSRRLDGSEKTESEYNRAEAALRDPLERMFFDTTTDIILFIRHKDGRIMEANEAAIRAYGYTKEQLLSLNIYDLRSIGTPSVVSSQMKEADSSGIRFEALHRRKDGSIFPVDVSSKGVTIRSERILVSIIRDISVRKEAERALQESSRAMGIVNRVANIFLTMDDDQMFAEVLRIVLDALQSKIGFFGYVDESGNLVIPSMPKETLERLQIPGREITFPRESWEGIWRRLLADGESFCSNEPLWVPGNHVPIQRAMAVPIVYQGKTIGAFSVSNKEEVYHEEDRKLLKLIASFVAPVLNARMLRHKQETDRKRVEEELRQSEERYRLLVELSPDAIFAHVDEKFVYLNPQATRLLGLPSLEVAIGKSIFDFYHPDYHALIRERIQQIREMGKPLDPIEQKYVRSDGRVIDVEVTGTPFPFNGKQAILTVARDISERKQSGESLMESEERFRDLFEHAPVGYYELDSRGRFTNINHTESEMLGYRPEEMVGQPVWRFTGDEEGVRKRVLAKLSGAIPPGKGLEVVYRRKDGTLFPVLIEDRVVKDKAGKIIGARGTVQDITERRRGEQELRLLQEQLHQAQKMEAIGTLAGGIAHDFNNILSVILGYAELASFDMEKASRAKSNLEQSIQAAYRAKDLVQQILAFSRQGKQEPKPLNLTPIVKEGLKFLRASLPATIEIHPDLDEDLGTIMADPTQVHQVLMNLCTNAFHAMEEKGGVLEVSLRNVALDRVNSVSAGIEAGPYVRLRISDTGHGIRPEVRKRIFDPYFTTKEPGRGTGLGLAVVHGIVKSSGGGISVSSDVGKGSTFDVYFPRIETGDTRLETYSAEVFPIGGRERVLFVDDEESIVEIGRKTLEFLGYDVVTRTSSIEALELFRVRGGEFDLVITDMTMPNMTGDRLVQELFRIRPGIPIILCTGFSEHITEEKAKGIGIREFLMKPMTMKELARAIRKVLDSPGNKPVSASEPRPDADR